MDDDMNQLDPLDAKLLYTAMLEAQMEGDDDAVAVLAALADDPDKLREVLGNDEPEEKSMGRSSKMAPPRLKTLPLTRVKSTTSELERLRIVSRIRSKEASDAKSDYGENSKKYKVAKRIAQEAFETYIYADRASRGVKTTPPIKTKLAKPYEHPASGPAHARAEVEDFLADYRERTAVVRRGLVDHES